jgi:hypothetical protein
MPGIDERCRDAFGEVFEGVGDFGAVAGGQGQVVDFVDGHDGDAGVDCDAADGLDDVGDVRPVCDRQAEEPGELGCDHPGCRCWRDSYIDDWNPVVQAGMAGGVDGLVGLAELGDRGGLSGPGGPGEDESSPGGDGVPVQQRQPASGRDDLPQHRGRDRGEPGVVVKADVVIGRPIGVGQSPPADSR